MGWTWTHKPRNIKVTNYLVQELINWTSDTTNYECLDIALVHLRTAYAAVKRTNLATGETTVRAHVFLIGYAPKSHYNFGYKDMCEEAGPCASECPARILKLLSSLNAEEHEYAMEWRNRCWNNIVHRVDRKIQWRNLKEHIKIGQTIYLQKHCRPDEVSFISFRKGGLIGASTFGHFTILPRHIDFERTLKNVSA